MIAKHTYKNINVTLKINYFLMKFSINDFAFIIRNMSSIITIVPNKMLKIESKISTIFEK